MTERDRLHIIDTLTSLGSRISWLERVVYGAAGGVAVTAFFITNGIVKVGG